MLLLLLLLLLCKHVRLLGLQMGQRVRVRGARLHTHRAGLTYMTTRSRYTLVHHALLHGMAGAGGAHDMALLHLHAGLRWKGTLHHLERVSC
jgi:hypothetical protein